MSNVSYNRRECDFKSLKDYNDYLEEIETIGMSQVTAACVECITCKTCCVLCLFEVYNLSNGIDIEETKSRVETYKKKNKQEILKIRARIVR